MRGISSFLGTARIASVVSALLVASVGIAAAHPHEFLDVELGLSFDKGALVAIGVVWTFDPINSRMILAQEAMDPEDDGILTAGELQRLTDMAGDWAEGYDGDLYLERAGRVVPLLPPDEIKVEFREGEIISAHRRRLAAPFVPSGTEVELRAYDPSYYIDYTLMKTVRLWGETPCQVTLVETDHDEAQLRLELLIGDRTDDEMMLDDSFPRVGRSFATVIRLDCAKATP